MSSRPVDSGTAFGRALRGAMTCRGITLQELGKALAELGTPLSTATLSYWTTGRALPTTTRALEAVCQIEQVLDLPAGQLVGLLPNDAVTQWETARMAPYSQNAQAALQTLGLWPLDQYRIVVVYDSVDINNQWRGQVNTTRQLIRAERDGLDRFPVILHTDETEAPLVTAGLGCRLGRVVMLPPDKLFIAELELSRALHAGELFWCSYRLTWQGPPGATVRLARVLTHPAEVLVMDSLSPQPGLEPSYSVTPYDADIQASPATVSRPLTADPYLQVAVTEPAQGSHVLRWSTP